MTLEIKALLAALVAAVLFGAGWTANGWRLNGDIDQIKAEQSAAVAAATQATADAQKREDDKSQALAAALGTIDTLQSAATLKAKNDTNTLRNAVASGAQRLYVHATCPPSPGNLPPTASGSIVDNSAAPGLTADAGQAYFSLRDGLTQQRGQLLACQEALAAERNGAATMPAPGD